MSITRRLFLRNTAAAGAVGATVAAPALPATAGSTLPPMSPREKAVWHMRELERLAIEDGAGSAMVMVVGRPWGRPSAYEHCKTLMIEKDGILNDFGDADFFASKGGAA